MTLTIIPAAPSVTPPLLPVSAITTSVLSTAVSEADTSQFLRTNLPPPFQSGDRNYHPLWMDHQSQYPQGIVDGEMPEEVPSPYQGMSAEWAATVSQLVFLGLAEIKDGQVLLTNPLRIRASGLTSRTIRHLDELEWLLTVHRDNQSVNSGVIEPLGVEEASASSWAAIARDPERIHPHFVKPWPKEPEPPAPPPKRVVEAPPQARPEPVPAYIQAWFEGRDQRPESLSAALAASLSLSDIDREEFDRHMRTMPKDCMSALLEFRCRPGSVESESHTALRERAFQLWRARVDFYIQDLERSNATKEGWAVFNRRWGL